MIFHDYEHDDDYDPPTTDWVDLTVAGSNLRVEVDVNNLGHFRHRDITRATPWRKGKG